MCSVHVRYGMRFSGALPTLSYLSLSYIKSLITNIRTQLLVMTHPQFPFLRLASLPFYQLLMLLCTIHQQSWQARKRHLKCWSKGEHSFKSFGILAALIDFTCPFKMAANPTKLNKNTKEVTPEPIYLDCYQS